MRHIIIILTLSVFIVSCSQTDTKQKELELKERELALKEKELELKENKSSVTEPNKAATNNSTEMNPNKSTTASNFDKMEKITKDDVFVGTWHVCSDPNKKCSIRLDGENYIFKNQYVNSPLTKKNNTLLEGMGGLVTIRYDLNSKHLILNDTGPIKEYCKD